MPLDVTRATGGLALPGRSVCCGVRMSTGAPAGRDDLGARIRFVLDRDGEGSHIHSSGIDGSDRLIAVTTTDS